jgi:hypothetical protein
LFLKKVLPLQKENQIYTIMVLTKIKDNQIAISLSAGVDIFNIERLINYAKYLEATASSQATQVDIDKLADDVNTNWWNNNKQRFLK